MRKLIASLAFFTGIAFTANAQTQKDWYMIGGEIANIGYLTQKDNNTFKLQVNPRIAWFVRDNLALGAKVVIGTSFSKSNNVIDYGIMPLARLYFKGNGLNSVQKTRWFFDASIGLQGNNSVYKNRDTSGNIINKIKSSSNGLGFDFGPGLTYFINQNIGLEGSVKYNAIPASLNGSNLNSISINVGMQIYLPKAKIRSMREDVKN